MSKLTKRITAMLLAGMLVIGSVPGSVLAASTDVDPGQTSEIAEEVYDEETSEAPASAGETSQVEEASEAPAGDGETAEEASAEEAQYYTVTLDANGGYFENEWDDAVGEIVEQAEVVTKQVLIGGSVAAVPVFSDQDGQTMLFAGWSLEKDGELVSQADEEYVPESNCALYAVWQASDEGAEQEDASQETNAAEGSGDSGTEESESAQEYENTEAVEEIETESEGTDEAETAQEFDETAEESNTAQEIEEDTKVDADEYTVPDAENEQDAALAEEVIYSDTEEEETSESSSDPTVVEEETILESSDEGESVKEDAANYVAESGTCGDNLTWMLDYAGTLTIIGTGEMYDYAYHSQKAPWASYTIKTVIIESGVKSIGAGAFEKCDDLTSVTIPNGMTSIGDYAFKSCKSLTNVTIPDSVTSIGKCAFWGCSSMANIVLPNGVTTIAEFTFYHCDNLTSVTIPNSVTRIEDDAFEFCKSLTNVTIPDSVTSIGASAFFYCFNLTSIVIPNSVTSIGDMAFYRELKVITFRGNAPTIGDCAFYNALAIAYYPANDPTWTDSKKVNYGGVITWKEDSSAYDDFMSIGSGRLTSSDMYGFKNPVKTINKNLYEKFFSSSQSKELYKNKEKKAHGLCNGMIVTAMATLLQDSPTVGSYGVNSLNDITSSAQKSNTTGKTVLDYVKYGHLSNYYPAVQIARIKNLYDLQGLYHAVIDYANGATDRPVLITINEGGDKHALWGLGVTEATKSRVTINVYDPNHPFDSDHPEENRELYLYKESGRFTGWEYEFSDGNIWGGDVNSSNDLLTYDTVTMEYFVLNYATNVLYETGDYNVLITFDMSDSQYSTVQEWAHEQQYEKNLLLIDNAESEGSQNSDLVQNYWYMGSQGDLKFDNVPAGVRISYAALNDSFSVSSEDSYDVAFSGINDCKGLIITNENKSDFTVLYYKPDNNSDHVDQLSITGSGETIEINNNDGNLQVTGVDNMYVSLESGEEDEEGIILDPKMSTHDVVNLSTDDNINIGISDSGDLSVETIEMLSNGTCGDNIKWTLYSDGTLTLSGKGAIPDYLMDMIPHAPWLFEKVKKVVIGNGITRIGNYAFFNIGTLQKAILPNSLKEIGWGAFHKCQNLKTVNIPSSVEVIEGFAFYETAWMTDKRKNDPYVIINGILIDGNTVQGDEIIIPANVKKIAPFALSYNANYTSVVIPEGVELIGEGSFFLMSGNEELNTVSLPKSIRKIEAKAFHGRHIDKIKYGGTPSDWEKLNISKDDNKEILYFANTISYTFVSIKKAIVSGIEDKTYSGKQISQTPTLKIGSSILKVYRDYSISFSNNTNVGTAKLVITGIGDYEGAVTKTFTITPAPLTDATVSGISNKTYTGSALTQNPTIKVGDKTLKKGTDYTISYANNTNVGTATVTITGKGNYTSKKTATFKINKAAQSITAKAGASRVAVGKTTTVSITGNKGKKSYKSSNTAIATVTSAGKVTAKKVGTVKITATSAATSNYNAASKTVTIKVVPAATASLTAANQTTGIKLTWKKVTGANGYKVYRGSTLIKTITSDSTVTYADAKANTNGTKYTYKVVAKATTGDSTLSKSRVIYRVSRPAVSSVTNSAVSKMTVKWGKNAKGNGYQIQYSMDKTFKSGIKSVSITSAFTVSKVFGSLKKSKIYYVRIRTYKTVGSSKYWSEWSPVKSVKIIK